MNVTPENNVVDRMKKDIELTLTKPHNVELLKKGTAITNLIQRLGKKYGIEDLTGERQDLYDVLSEFLRSKIKEKTMNTSNNLIESILKEADIQMPRAGHILRYDDDKATKVLKDVLTEKFPEIKIEQINGQDGGAFYTCILVTKLEDSVSKDIERNRFFLNSTIMNFKSAFTGAISELLPVINVTTGSYLSTKNSTALKFTVTVLLSHTDDREWVSGNYKKIDEEAQEEIVEKEIISEAGNGRKSLVDPMPLDTAVRKFKSKQINLEVLETAIKACGRAELEFFVLRYVGVDISQVKANDKPEDEKEPETPLEDTEF